LRRRERLPSSDHRTRLRGRRTRSRGTVTPNGPNDDLRGGERLPSARRRVFAALARHGSPSGGRNPHRCHAVRRKELVFIARRRLLIRLPRFVLWHARSFSQTARTSGQPSDERACDGKAKRDEGVVEVTLRPRTRSGGRFSPLGPRGEKPARVPQRGTRSRRAHRSRGVASPDRSVPRSGRGPARL
jgi:hypothetical protein